jgi:hypothetical protein
VSSPATRRSIRGKNPLALEESNVESPSAACKPRAARLTHQSLSAIEEKLVNTLPAATKEVSFIPSLMKSPPESRASADQNLSSNEEETINTVAAATKEVSTVPSLQKSAPKSRAPGNDLMGSSDSQGVRTNAIENSGIATAASTLIYWLQYGKDKTVNKSKYEYKSSGDECDDDSGGSDALKCKELETSKYVPRGLEYSDDDDILIDIDSDEEELRSSFPRDKSRKNMVLGGPKKPDVSMCTESEGKVLLQRYAKARKAYTDKQQTACVKSDKSFAKSSSFTGKQNDRLCTMNKVEKSGLIDNQTFKSKYVLQLCISEEANLRDINTIAIWSDYTNVTVIGINFYVNVTFSEKVGWRVQTAICWEGDDILKIPPKDKYNAAIEKDRKQALCTPIKSKYVVPFINAAIGNNPGMAYQAMKDIMKP